MKMFKKSFIVTTMAFVLLMSSSIFAQPAVEGPAHQTIELPDSLKDDEVLKRVVYEARNLPIYDLSSTRNSIPTTALSYGERAPVGVYTKELSSGYTNTFIINENDVWGIGKMTVFDDKEGDWDSDNQEPITLKEGDAATNKYIDNPYPGTRISVTSNDETYILRKNDTGSLPISVLDIWKWSGTKWGKQYSSTLTLNGYYTYNY